MSEGEFRVAATDLRSGASSTRDEVSKSVASLVESYRARGLQVSTVAGPRALRLFEPRPVDLESFAAFNSELAAACRARLPLPGTLRALTEDLGSSRLRQSLRDVAREVEEGRSLPDAFAAQSDVFPPGYVALVRAGLAAQDLPGVLLDVAIHSRIAHRAMRQSRIALVYPLFLALVGSALLAGFAATDGLGTARVYEDLGAELPWLTETLYSLFPTLEWAPAILLAAVLLAWIAWRVASRAEPLAAPAASLVLRVPFIGPFLRALALARFTRVLAATLSRGVSVPDAIALAGLASGNAAVQKAADSARRGVLEGASLADALGPHRVFPRVLVWLLDLSEIRGDALPVLADFATLEEERMERAGDFLPVVVSVGGLAAAALLVAGIAIAVFLPLISLVDKLG